MCLEESEAVRSVSVIREVSGGDSICEGQAVLVSTSGGHFRGTKGVLRNSFWTGRPRRVQFESGLTAEILWSHYVCTWNLGQHGFLLDIGSRELQVERSPVAVLPAFRFGSQIYERRNVRFLGRSYAISQLDSHLSLFRESPDLLTCILRLDHRFFGWRSLVWAREFALPSELDYEDHVLITALVIDQAVTFKG